MNATSKAAPRRWWIAALLNTYGVGVGYLYLGRPQRALVAAAVNLVPVIVWIAPGNVLARVPPLAILWLVSALAIPLYFVVDAIRIARRTKDYSARWYNRWWVYAGCFVIPILAWAIAPSDPVHNFSVSAGSMEPTLRTGERFLADLRAFSDRGPERGDVVVFRLPRSPSVIFFDRVIGLPGEEVLIRDGVVSINGRPVPKERKGEFLSQGETRAIPRYEETLPNGVKHFVLDAFPNGEFDNGGPYRVPPEHYFVMGDHRDNSTDSRALSPRFGVGYVPRSNIFGKAAWISWSRDLSRLGQKVHR